MTRSRVKSQDYIIYRSSATNTLQTSPMFGKMTSEWIEEHRIAPRMSNVRHHKCLQPANGFYGTFWDVDHVWYNATCPLDSAFPPELSLLKETLYSECFKGPADNNDFELLTFAADIDDSIAMFSKKFLKELSYGAFTWGVLPFVDDLKSLINSIQDINSGLARYPHCTRIKRQRTFSRQYKFDETFYEGSQFSLQSVDAKVLLNGVLTFNPPDLSTPLEKARFLLDELGVHPDLKTIWDVIPLSFVLDYFLPIGDLLESLHPRGWGSYSYTYEGFLTVSGRYETAYVIHPWGQNPSSFQPALWSMYEREFRQATSAPAAQGVEFQAPSLKELFNVGYLQGLLRPIDKVPKAAWRTFKRR